MSELNRAIRMHFGGQLPALVMFDLDGTLVDSVPDLAVAVDAMLEELGRAPAGEEVVRHWVGNGAQVLVQRALANSVAVPPLSQLDDESQGVQAQAHQSFLKHYRQVSGRHSRLYPGVKQALTYLKSEGVKLAIVTNKPIEFVPHLLRDLGIDVYFDHSVGGDSFPQKKPHPQPLYEVMAMFSISAEQALMVGDSRNDIEAGKAAHVATLAVPYGYNHGRPVSDESPDFICDSLAQLQPS